VALALMWLEASVLLCVTIAGGVRFSTVTNGIVAFASTWVAFFGGWVEQIGVDVRQRQRALSVLPSAS